MRYEGMPRPKAKAKEPSLDTAKDINRITRVEKTYSELREQGDRFRSSIEYTKNNCDRFINDLCERKIDRVALIGCGDSWFVGTSLELLIEKLLGCTCQGFEAFEFYSYRCDNLNKFDVVIGQSASGTTKAVLGALQKAREKGAYTVGISNTDDADILHKSDFGLLIQAQRQGWPTQATTSAIGSIAYLFARLSIVKERNVQYANEILEELEEIPDKMDKVIKDVEPEIKLKVHLFKTSVFFQSTGAGPLVGAAQVACAKLRELCPVHASTFPLEEFHHYRTLKPGDPLILFLNGISSKEKEIDTALVGAYDGGLIIAIGSEIPYEIHQVADLECVVPSTVHELQSVISMIPAHLFAYYLAKTKYDCGIGYPSEA